MNQTRPFKKYLLVLMMVLSIIVSFTPIARADVGPKPSLNLIVKGLDDDDYWLDLLVREPSEHSWLEITNEEMEAVSKLANYTDDEGFHPALLGGTNVPLSGNLKGERQKDGSYLHRFGYVGVPKEFKIAILLKDGQLIISDVVQRNHFQSVMEYDLESIEITEEVITSAGQVSEKMPWLDLTLGFFMRLFATLFIEVVVAFALGFKSKQALKIILYTNIATQVILNGMILFTETTNGFFVGMFVYLVAEVFVLLVEMGVYDRLLTDKSRPWRITYAILANIFSLVAGFYLFLIP